MLFQFPKIVIEIPKIGEMLQIQRILQKPKDGFTNGPITSKVIINKEKSFLNKEIMKQNNSYFYTEILTRKVVLWCFFTSETSEKIESKSQFRT